MTNVDTHTQEQLTLIVSQGTPTYSQTARDLLNGTLTWGNEDVASFIDGFFNDPYLTRNS